MEKNLKKNIHVDFPRGSAVKNLRDDVGDVGLIHGSEISLGEGDGNPLQ